MDNNFREVRIIDGKAQMINHPVTMPVSNFIVVRPLFVGVCRSDIKEIQNNRYKRHDFGHEIVAEVVTASESINLSPGELVCLDPHVEIKRNSGFSEVLTAVAPPEILEKAFLKLPEDAFLKRFVFCEPLACVNHCVSNILKYLHIHDFTNLKVGVIGAGNAGTLLTLVMRYLGAEVTLFNRKKYRIDFLKSSGMFLEQQLKLLDTDNFQKSEYDIVVCTTSFLIREILDFAFSIIRNHGLVMLFAGTKPADILIKDIDLDEVRRNEILVEFSLENKLIQVGGTYGALTNDFHRSMHFLSSYAQFFPVENLISAEIPLKKLPKVLNTLAIKDNYYYGKIIVKITE